MSRPDASHQTPKRFLGGQLRLHGKGARLPVADVGADGERKLLQAAPKDVRQRQVAQRAVRFADVQAHLFRRMHRVTGHKKSSPA